MYLWVFEKRERVKEAGRSAFVYKDMRRGIYVKEDLEAFRNIMNGTVLYPAGHSRLYTTVINRQKEVEPTHPFSQATQYFIDKYGYPDGLKMFVMLHVPHPAREQIILQIDQRNKKDGRKPGHDDGAPRF